MQNPINSLKRFEKTTFALENLSYLRQTIRLEEKMGKSMGRSEIL
jgi:hypothetical protein